MFVANFLIRLMHLSPSSPKASAPNSSKAAGEQASVWRLCPCVRERNTSIMARKPWSFKEDRRLMELAKSSTPLEKAAKLLGRSPEAVRRMALRLGLSLKPKSSKDP